MRHLINIHGYIRYYLDTVRMWFKLNHFDLSLSSVKLLLRYHFYLQICADDRNEIIGCGSQLSLSAYMISMLIQCCPQHVSLATA